jgi:hypothetical protein
MIAICVEPLIALNNRHEGFKPSTILPAKCLLDEANLVAWCAILRPFLVRT